MRCDKTRKNYLSFRKWTFQSIIIFCIRQLSLTNERKNRNTHTAHTYIFYVLFWRAQTQFDPLPFFFSIFLLIFSSQVPTADKNDEKRRRRRKSGRRKIEQIIILFWFMFINQISVLCPDNDVFSFSFSMENQRFKIRFRWTKTLAFSLFHLTTSISRWCGREDFTL